jgi:hypothetical protein
MGRNAPHPQIVFMIQFIDWWAAERPGFVGSAALEDAADARTAEARGRVVARMFVMEAAAAAIGDKRPVRVDADAAESYVVALIPADDPEGDALFGVVAALHRKDTLALACALYRASVICVAQAASHSARRFARLSYRASLEVGSWEDAWRAARVLQRLAVLDENPVAAHRWEARADLQLRRVQGGSPHV